MILFFPPIFVVFLVTSYKFSFKVERWDTVDHHDGV